MNGGMSKIFCLETEWTQSVHDMKKVSPVQSLLEFVSNTLDVQYVFRQVAVLQDFDYYIRHLEAATYGAYDIVYLCFHGSKGSIQFADKFDYSLLKLADDYNGLFTGRTIIFDSCCTLKLNEDDMRRVKTQTGARIIIGYTKSVDLVSSFVFELWLLSALIRRPYYGSKRLLALAEKEMPQHVKKLGFVCY